ncbi:hypothetical protein BDK51DRAFT_45547 [Blyttiomyces helicus]|uniref:Pentacotripeptide-repeat region of PRORP domain-containing protein n=1 Tax=Blyttiomyces helicus TaxID=388810 RepID=A0A4P9WGF0_9FUNG|nr:hypothetical protein BDK51DRAFT_45547 [Blyttiomyces helicus]|eukprot:RKO91889.1 hypothetical protein BDK51DRAFT_45547 [Blyttiomyces helicus]
MRRRPTPAPCPPFGLIRLLNSSSSCQLNRFLTTTRQPPSPFRPSRLPAFAYLPPSLPYSTARDPPTSESSLPAPESSAPPDSSADPAPSQPKPAPFSWLSLASSAAAKNTFPRAPSSQAVRHSPVASEPPPAEHDLNAGRHDAARSLESERDARRQELNESLNAQLHQDPLSPARTESGPLPEQLTPPRQPDPAPREVLLSPSSVEEELNRPLHHSPPDPPPLTKAEGRFHKDFGRTSIGKPSLASSKIHEHLAEPRGSLVPPLEDELQSPHPLESKSKRRNVLGVRRTELEVARRLNNGRSWPRVEPAPGSSGSDHIGAETVPMATSRPGAGVRITQPEIQRPGFVPNTPSSPVRTSPRSSSNQARAPAHGKPSPIENFRAAVEARDATGASRIYRSLGTALAPALTADDCWRYLSLVRRQKPDIKPMYAVSGVLSGATPRERERLARARHVETTSEDLLRDGATFSLGMTNEVALAYAEIGAGAEVDRVIEAGEARSAGEKLFNAPNLRLLARAKAALSPSSLPTGSTLPNVSELVDEMDALLPTFKPRLIFPTFNAVLEEVVKRGDEAAYERMWALADKYEFPTDTKAFEIKIEYTAKRDIDAARRLVQDGPKRGFPHTIRNYNTILNELVRTKRREEITPLFRDMEENGVRANAATYAILLTAYDPEKSFGEEDPVAAATTFLAMCTTGITPILGRPQSPSLARALRSVVVVDDLEPFLAREGLAPHKYLYEALISGFSTNRENDLALRVADLYLAHSAVNRGEWLIDEFFCVRYVRSLGHVGRAGEWQRALEAFTKAGQPPTGAIFDQILVAYGKPTAPVSEKSELAVAARKVFDRMVSYRIRTADYPRTLTRLLSLTWDEMGEEPLNKDALTYIREYAKHAPALPRHLPRQLLGMRRAISIVGNGDYSSGIIRLRQGDVSSDLPLVPPGPDVPPSALVDALRDLIAAGHGAEWEAVVEDWTAQGEAPTTGAYNIILASLGTADREAARRIFDAMRAGGPEAAPNSYTYGRLLAIEWRGEGGEDDPSPLSDNAMTYLEAFADANESPAGLSLANRHISEDHLYATLHIFGKGSPREGIERLRARGGGPNASGAHDETPKEEDPSTAL